MNFVSKISRWYFSRKALPYWGIFLLDCGMTACALLLVSVWHYGVVAALQNIGSLCGTLLVYLCCFVVGFRLFHTYSGIIRYSSFIDLQRVGFAALTGLMLVVSFNAVFRNSGFLVEISLQELILATLLAVMLMWAFRISVKYLYDSTYKQKQAKRIFIYGVKQGGVSLAKSILNQDPSPYSLAGFVSDVKDVQKHRLMGVRIYPNNEYLVAEMKAQHADILFVSPLKNEELRENAEMVNRLVEGGIRIYMTPAALEWDGKSELNHAQLKEVDVEDLLPRDKIEIDMQAVGNLLTGRKILITGAAGSIGSEMVRQISVYHPAELILVDQAETPLHDIRLMMAHRWPDIKAYTLIGDISNKARMEEIYAGHLPDYVFHAAAYKHVPMMEDNPSESVQNNVEGTRIIADLAVKYGARKFVMISTDKAVNPTNVMGCSKRICEIYVQSLDKAIKEGKVKGITQFVTTRFGNVLGSNGSVIPLFKEQIKEGGPVTVTHPDIIRFFMLIPEACKLVLEAGTMGKGGEIYVFDMGKPVRIADLAQRMIYLSGAKNVEIKYTGLRDGEKLYEEVLSNAETTLPTFHPKIKIAKVREYDYEEVNRRINELVRHSYEDDNMQIVRRMKELVPEFKSQHSVYEVLDGNCTETASSR